MNKYQWSIIIIICILNMTQIYAKSLPKDEVYRTSTNNKSIEVISSEEVEMRSGSDIIIGSYSFKRDRLRIVYSMFGSKNVEYYDFMPQGLLGKKGVIFYSTAQYKILQKQMLKEEEARRLVKEEKLKAKREAREKREQDKLKKSLEKKFCQAAAKGNIEIMQSLLDSGVDINASCSALDRARAQSQFRAIKFLIKNGIDANGKDGYSLCYFAGKNKKDMVKLLLENGADPNHYKSYPALISAINNGYSDIALMLYRYGADIDEEDKKGNNALDISITKKNIELFKIFINDKDLKDETKSKALETLVKSYYGRFDYKAHNKKIKLEMLNILLDKKVNSCEAIDAALYTCDISHIYGGRRARALEESLIKFITELFPNCQDVNGEVVLNRGKDRKSSLLFTLVYANSNVTNVIKMLLDKGADINYKNELGWTPLHVAVGKWNNNKVIEFLVKNGADVNAENNKGQIPFDLAQHNNKDLLKKLSKTESKVQIKQKTKESKEIKIPKEVIQIVVQPSKNTQEPLKEETKYSMVFNVVPSDAKIDITNIKDIFHQGIQLKKGKYYVEISKQGYKTFNNSFELTKNFSFDVVLEKERIEQISANTLNNKINTILHNLEAQTQQILTNRKNMKYSQFIAYHDKVTELENVINSYQGNDKKWLADKYGVLSWYQNLTNEQTKAIASAKRGLSLDSSLNWINKTLAHAYLFSGNAKRAKKIYLEHMYTTVNNGKTSWEDSVLQDFDFFTRFGINYPMYDEVYQAFKSPS